MPLLDLPPEILQQLLRYCTTPSFFHIIRTCKTFFYLAEASRTVILHRLEQVPGITLGLHEPTISTHDLFLMLRRRGATHLVGSNITGDCTDFSVGYGTIDPNASWMADNFIALALKDSFRVRLYEVKDASCKLRCASAGGLAPMRGVGKILKVVTVLDQICTLFSYSPQTIMEEAHSPKYLESCRRPIEGDVDHEGSAMVDTELSSLGLDGTCYYVALGGLHSNGERFFQVPTPAPWLGRVLVPVDLAIYGRLQCAVLWDLPYSIKPSIFAQVIEYTASNIPEAGTTGMYFGERIWPSRHRPHEEILPEVRRTNLPSDLPHSLQFNIPPQPQPLPDRVARTLKSSRMAFLPRGIAFAQDGRLVKMFTPGGIVPYHVADTSTDARGSSDDEDSPNSFSISRSPWVRSLHNLNWTLTTSFYSQHVTQVTRRAEDDADDGAEVEETCTTSYLSLATTKVSRKRCFLMGMKVLRDKIETEVLCIMRAITTLPSNECTHLAEDNICASSRLGRVRVVARLWGWQPSDSSLAGERNVACCHTRVAIAEWDRIFIWSLDPKALIDEADDPASPYSSTSNNDSHSDTGMSDDEPEAGETRKEKAWTYPKVYDGIMDAWYVELKPIVLSASKSGSSGGNGSARNNGDTVLIRQLMWNDPNTLVVRTDRGLQIWNLGPRATGKRTQEVLEMDISEQADCVDFNVCEKASIPPECEF